MHCSRSTGGQTISADNQLAVRGLVNSRTREYGTPSCFFNRCQRVDHAVSTCVTCTCSRVSQSEPNVSCCGSMAALYWLCTFRSWRVRKGRAIHLMISKNFRFHLSFLKLNKAKVTLPEEIALPAVNFLLLSVWKIIHW